MSSSVKQGKTHFTKILQAALDEGPQRLDCGDNRHVLVISEEDFKRIAKYPTTADLILGFPGEPEDLPQRRAFDPLIS
jgi:hypothetical protein